MKARIRTTGEIVDVTETFIPWCDYVDKYGWVYETKDGRQFSMDEIDFVNHGEQLHTFRISEDQLSRELCEWVAFSGGIDSEEDVLDFMIRLKGKMVRKQDAQCIMQDRQEDVKFIV